MLCWWEVIHTVALLTERHRYVAPPEVVCSAPTDMYRPGPIHNTGRYVAGVALHTATATYRVQARHIGGATFLRLVPAQRPHGRGLAPFYPIS